MSGDMEPQKSPLLNDGFQHENEDVSVDIPAETAPPGKVQRSLSRQVVKKDIVFNNISYTVPVKIKGKKTDKAILKNVSGILKPGLNAILGPTGSGKTTLLDVLAGRKDRQYLSGDVIVDGQRQPEDFRLMSGYVVQEDIIMGTLSVEENLRFSADLRLPKSYKKKDRKDRVEMVMGDLGLSGVASSKVGTEYSRGISGGEKKRTMIGMELITSPNILFLDEPTTGLDAATAYTVVSLLKAQGDAGRTVVFSIHQPRYSIFRLFDSVTLLSDGEIVYHGEGSKALQHFQTIGYECEMYNNPADFILDVITYNTLRKRQAENGRGLEESIDYKSTGISSILEESKNTTLSEAYHKSDACQKAMLEVKPVVDSVNDIEMENSIAIKTKVRAKYESSYFRQLTTVAARAFTNIIRNPQLLISQTFSVAMLAVIIGIIYLRLDKGPSGLQNRVGVFLFLSMNVVFSNIGAVQLFIKEKPIFRHESASGYYRVSTYFISKAVCDIAGLRLVPTIMYACISYWMVGLVANGVNFLIFALTLFITAVCACGLAFFVSASVRTFPVAQLLIILPTIIMLVFSGVFVNLHTMPAWLSWLKYLSIFRYALSTLVINELHGMTFDCGTDPKTHKPKPCPSGDEYMASQGISPDDLWINIMALAIVTLGLMILAYIQLRRLKKFK